MNVHLWYQDAVFYQVYPRAFRDADGDGHGDLRGLVEKLDYLRDLGVDCLWLMPVYPSPLKDDGYDIADYFAIHPTYGTLDDFKTLVAEAHARGLRVITDLVLNHTSDQHPWFQAARADRRSPYRDYYVWSDTDQKYKDARIIFLDTEPSNWTWDERAGQFFWHRFYSSQPDLNYDSPAVRAAMLDVARFWLDLGVDGFRADAVPYLFEREGTNCENLPETHAYLKELRRFLDEHYPGRILLCEANQWPEDVRPYFGDPAAGPGQAEFHMAFHFPVMPRLYMALRRGDAEPLDWILTRTPPIPPGCHWCTFLRNHDELTLEMVTEDERQWMWREYAPEARMRLNLGIRRRLAPLLDGDRRKQELLTALLFALPGSPIIYYGDEIGMGDNLWLPDRNGVRTPMQWDATPSAGFSPADPARFYAPVIDSAQYGPARVNVADQQADPDSLYHFHRDLIRARKTHPALSRGATRWRLDAGRAVFTLFRSLGRETLAAVYNLSGQPQTLALDSSGWPDDDSRPAFASRAAGAPTLSGRALALPPYGFVWLVWTTTDH